MLYQVASISGDAILFGLDLLFVGLLAKALQDVVITRGTLVALYGLCLALAFTKPSYVWIGWATLACVGRPWIDVSIGKVAFAAVVIVSPVLVHGFLIAEGFQAAPIAPGIDAAGNWRDTLDHPFKFALMLSRVVETYPIGTRWNLWQSTIGKLGWLDAPLPMILYPVLTISISIAAGLASLAVSWRVRLFLLTLAVISVGLVALPIRIYAMPGPSNVIFGLAGRYFIPSLSILMLALSFALPAWLGQIARVWVIGFSIVGLAFGALAITQRYYP